MNSKDIEARPRLRADAWVPVALLVLAALGWWISLGAGSMGGEAMPMDAHMTMSFAAFLVAWVAMMAAMMFPAVLPVVRLYARAAAAGHAAPVIVFVGGYIAVWSVVGIPAFFAWTWLDEPVAQAAPWAGRLAGVVAVTAGVYQLTPLKSVCLQHCRSPMSFFLHHAKHLDRPKGALVAGGRHGLFCLGCCWMLMVLLVAFGTMNVVWMLALAALIFLEKVAPLGEWLARGAALTLVPFGAALLLYPTFFVHLV